MEKIITEQNFDAELASKQPLVVDFSATWCGPCKKVAPIMTELAEEYEGRVTVGKADVEECAGLAARYGIASVPTILFFKDGVLVDRMVGAAPKSKFAEKFDTLL